MNNTREYILNVSLKLFLQKSFKEVTMNELVKETGLSKGAFYHYFESKEQLFLEIVDYAFSSFITIDYSGFCKDSLAGFFNDYIAYLKNSGSLFERKMNMDGGFNLNYYSLIFDALRYFPGFRDKMSAISQSELNTWISVMHTARQNGEISSAMNDEQIANLFLQINSGVSMNNIIMGKFENTLDDLLILWNGVYNQIKV